MIFIFTEGHAGNAPNSVADAAATAHLRSRVTSAYEMDLARHVTNRACIYMHEEEGHGSRSSGGERSSTCGLLLLSR